MTKEIKTVEKLDRETTNHLLEVRRAAQSIESKISDRADYIIRAIYKAFGKKLEWWAYPNSSDENSEGVFDDAIDNYYEEFYFDRASALYDCVAIIKYRDKEGEYQFDGSFPLRWLYEDFEEELKNGIIKFEQKEQEKKDKAKAAREAKKAAKEAALEAAKKKLSKEELEALGIR